MKTEKYFLHWKMRLRKYHSEMLKLLNNFNFEFRFLNFFVFIFIYTDSENNENISLFKNILNGPLQRN